MADAIRGFSNEKWDLLVTCMNTWDVLTQKGSLRVTGDKNYESFSKV